MNKCRKTMLTMLTMLTVLVDNEDRRLFDERVPIAFDCGSSLKPASLRCDDAATALLPTEPASPRRPRPLTSDATQVSGESGVGSVRRIPFVLSSAT